MVHSSSIVAFDAEKDGGAEPRVIQQPKRQRKPAPAEPPNVRARLQVLQVLRSLQGIDRVLQVPIDPTDKELIVAIASHQQPFAALRSCGCSLAQAAATVDLLPLATTAPEPKGRHPCRACLTLIFSGIRWEVVVAGVCCFAALILCTVAAMLMTTYTNGWIEGTCSFSAFTNETCGTSAKQCSMVVEVRGNGQMRRMNAWYPGVDRPYGAGRNAWRSEAFRCCDIDDCCNFYDELHQAFCDKWAHRTDEGGRQCPGSDWPCLFKLEQSDTEDSSVTQAVAELQAFVPMVVWPFFVGAALLVLLAALVMSWEHMQTIYERHIEYLKAKSLSAYPDVVPPTASPELQHAFGRRGQLAHGAVALTRASTAMVEETASQAMAANQQASFRRSRSKDLRQESKDTPIMDRPVSAQSTEPDPPGFVEPAEPEGEPPSFAKSGAALNINAFLPPPLPSSFPSPSARRTPLGLTNSSLLRPDSGQATDGGRRRGSGSLASGRSPTSSALRGAGHRSPSSPASPAGRRRSQDTRNVFEDSYGPGSPAPPPWCSGRRALLLQTHSPKSNSSSRVAGAPTGLFGAEQNGGTRGGGAIDLA